MNLFVNIENFICLDKFVFGLLFGFVIICAIK